MIEYFSTNMWQAWAVVAVLCLILELSSGDFFIMCFAIGAIGAAVVSPFANIYVQLVAFAVVTALSLVLVRPFALRFLHRNEENRASNGDAVVGKEGHVTETIKAGGYGRVALAGDDWKAKSTSAEDLPVGTAVKAVALDSVVLTVEKL